MTVSQASNEWYIAKIRFSLKVYNVMLSIIKNEKPKILLNRNPTLNFYSMLLLNIRTVKPNFHDYTLSVPVDILAGLNKLLDKLCSSKTYLIAGNF